MDDALFKALTICDAKKCWVHIKDTVCTQLLGEEVFPIPYLEDASFYDIAGVVLKEERSPFEKLLRKPASTVIAGKLPEFTSEEYFDGLTDRLPHSSVDKTVSLNTDYVFEESDMHNGLKKTVNLRVLGCEKWSLDYLPRTGDLVVDMSLKGYSEVGKIYLIDEIYYVKELTLHVSIGDEEDEYTVKGKVPIGFRLFRYYLYPDGTLWERKRVEKKTWKVRWTKRSLFRRASDALPRSPSKLRHATVHLRGRGTEIAIQTSKQKIR